MPTTTPAELPDAEGHWTREDDGDSSAPAFWSILVRYKPFRLSYSGWHETEAVEGFVDELPSGKWLRARPPASEPAQRGEPENWQTHERALRFKIDELTSALAAAREEAEQAKTECKLVKVLANWNQDDDRPADSAALEICNEAEEAKAECRELSAALQAAESRLAAETARRERAEAAMRQATEKWVDSNLSAFESGAAMYNILEAYLAGGGNG